MSVARILETYDPVIAEERTYWKAFKVGNDDGLEFPHWDIEGHYTQSGLVPLGVWLTAVQNVAPTIRGEKYVTGFHVFETKEGAEEWNTRTKRIVLAVECRGIRHKYLHCRENHHKDEPTIVGYVVDEMKVVR